MKIFYNDNYVASNYAFDTTRKSQHIAEEIRRTRRHQILDPGRFEERTQHLIADFHSGDYITAIVTGEPASLATSQGFEWDKGIYTMALAHNAGCIAAVDTAARKNTVTATLSSGLHHARKEHGEGYCTFNGVALATRHLGSLGITTTVIDLDAHFGGGTYEMINPDHTFIIDISVNEFDRYATRDIYDRAELVDPKKYVEEIMRVIDSSEEALESADFFIYNAGVDPINYGVNYVQMSLREEFMAELFKTLGKPVAIMMAGGYAWSGVTMNDIRDLHIDTIETIDGIVDVTARPLLK